MSDFNCNCTPTYPNGAASPIPPFWGFSAFTPTIPKLYWDVKSQEQRILNLFDLLNKLVCYCDSMGLQIDVNAQDIQEIRDYVNEFLTSGFDDALAEKIAKWIDDHLQFIFTHTIRQVYFGLTDDTYSGGAGYFVAYIPDSWSDIVFDTGAVYGLDTYGRLILRWDADSPYSVEQKPEYNDIELSGLIAEIKTTADNAMSLAEANEKGISTNDGEIAALDTRVTALEKA